ncbi:MAG TPA: hypothetical protein VFS93_08120 [Terrimesophilobacter sp.]|nr:hypothetical protein [Terrimesophilobacter sp.]
MTRWTRVARGTLAALVSTFVAAFSHLVAGGPLPGAAGLALCLAFSWLVCIALAGRRWPRMRLAASIAASQAMFHGVFSALGGTASAVPTTIPPVGAPTTGHDHGALALLTPLAGHTHTTGDMWLAHLTAAVVTFVALAYGERSAATIAGFARTIVLGLLARMPEPVAESARVRLTATRIHAEHPRVRRLEFAELRHRGPPPARLA